MTTTLQDKLLIYRQLLDGDFNKLCTIAIGANLELKRFNIRYVNKRKERKERLSSKLLVARPTTYNLLSNLLVKLNVASFSLL